LNRFTATQASPRADAPRFTPAEIRASRADRVVVTPQGKARELALLRRQFGEGSSIAGSLLEFTKKQGDEELRIHFDPAVGAVTRMVLYNNQKKRTEIVRRYRREGDMWLIAAIETKTFDESGRISSHSVEDIRSIEMR
ncbi:MAG TPA: hypothetical protein VFI91_07195, partial [Longimicrobiaceae bacterium]|nr:hypothetical protein [Longimicrobiaceae bacterium]